MALYIGTNYHPHDWEESLWEKDIDLMKQAGFNTVRLGHLCWDSYEPEEGVFTFEWFDKIMDLCEAKQLSVVLDVSMHPAPVWVHKLCPGCNISGPSGNPQASLRRYMDDVDDPAYQKYAYRFAEKLVNRYKGHPALFAFALCNELGDGYINHSEYARQRFIGWLKKKYGTIETLNRTWATKRWSRKLSSFDEVALQENEIAIGAPEAWLDMRRFFSDGVGNFVTGLKDVVEENAPGVPHSSNHYAEKDDFGFDYMKEYQRFVQYPGMGFYPGYTPNKNNALITTLTWYMGRIAETGRPMWCMEFLTGAKGITAGTYGLNRMYAFICLLHRAQMVLGWTYRSMLSGEEQFLYGLLNHDGMPNANYREYTEIAEAFKKLEPYGFPYLPKPEIAVANSFDSKHIGNYHKEQFRLPHLTNMTAVTAALEKQNYDYNIVDLRNIQKEYKLLLIPGYIIMDEKSAAQIRKFVGDGGTVIMSGYSAIMDETGKAFAEARPGRLSDVFGIRIRGCGRTNGIQLTDEEEARITRGRKSGNELIELEKDGESLSLDVDYYENIGVTTAEIYASSKKDGSCAISKNYYGRGTAYYFFTESNEMLWDWMLKQVSAEVGLADTVAASEGIYARRIAENQTFYVNTTGANVKIPILQKGHGVLSERDYETEFVLEAFNGELIVE